MSTLLEDVRCSFESPKPKTISIFAYGEAEGEIVPDRVISILSLIFGE